MDVVEAIMKIFADIFALNNYSDTMSNLLIGTMTSFFQGMIAIVQVFQNVFALIGG